MKAATLPRSPRWPRLGRRGFAGLGFLVATLAGMGWITWRSSVDPWPAKVTLGGPGTLPLGFSPDGKTFLTVTDGVVTPWDVASGRRSAPWPEKVIGHVMASSFSPDGRTFAYSLAGHPSETARVHLVDTVDGRRRASFEVGRPCVLGFSWPPGGGTLQAYLGDYSRLDEVATWDLATDLKTSSRAVSPPMGNNSGGISPDGRVLALYSRTKPAVYLWDLEKDLPLATLANPANSEPTSQAWAGFSADNRTVVFGREDGSVELWDVPGQKLLKSIRLQSRGYSPAIIRISPDGRTFASAAWERPDPSALGRIWRGMFGRRQSIVSEVVVIDIASGRTLARSRTSMDPIYSPDGRTIATRDDHLGIQLRDVPPSPR